MLVQADIGRTTCDKPLGMITGEIKDWQISASSTYPREWDRKSREKYARPYLPNGYAWCARLKNTSEWLLIDLGVTSKVIVVCCCSVCFYVSILLCDRSIVTSHYSTVKVSIFYERDVRIGFSHIYINNTKAVTGK